MQSLTLENLAAGDKEILSSRRKFLTNLACGSLLFLAGTGIASARAKHFAARKTVQKSSGKTTRIATKSHQKLKNTISNRLAKKSGHVHEQLAAHHSHGNHHKHSKHSRIQLASHKPTRSRLYRDDAVVLDTYEDRQYFA
ncbi:MAG: hypothetical protein PHN45_08010, partial [Methylococcales bacterium]|nr:hypothetical protein [Methylococcales bacterium]